MTVRSVSFDDDSVEELFVFSGNDLLTAHYAVGDLDRREVAERAALDQRRGLVIAQVAVLEDLIDEFILYLVDPIDVDAYQAKLDRRTIGPRVDRLEKLLARANVLDSTAVAALETIRQVVARRNELAHRTIHCRPVEPVEPDSWIDGIPLEWILFSRRTRTEERITMVGLRQDVNAATSAMSSMLRYAERFVEVAPRPRNYGGGRYLGAPTP
jgi:hypothetical protein